MFLSVIDELPSTQDYLSTQANIRILPEWTICRTLHQNKGKGMGANSWESEKNKNLLFSLFLRPVFLAPFEAFSLSKLIALGIRDTLQEFVQQPVYIKWPNDIFIKNKKVCGMLVENTFTDTSIQSCLIGIGININQGSFPASLPNASSLITYTHKPLPLEAILREALQRIKQYYQQVRLSGAETLNDNYLGHLYQRNQWHEYETDSGRFEGRITGVAPYGFLQIEDRQGNVHTFDVKQVRYL